MLIKVLRIDIDYLLASENLFITKLFLLTYKQ